MSTGPMGGVQVELTSGRDPDPAAAAFAAAIVKKRKHVPTRVRSTRPTLVLSICELLLYKFYASSNRRDGAARDCDGKRQNDGVPIKTWSGLSIGSCGEVSTPNGGLRLHPAVLSARGSLLSAKRPRGLRGVGFLHFQRERAFDVARVVSTEPCSRLQYPKAFAQDPSRRCPQILAPTALTEVGSLAMTATRSCCALP